MIGSPFWAAVSKLVRPVFGGMGHILMYHRVVPSLPPRKSMGAQIEVDVPQFTDHLEYFTARGYRFISLDEMVENLSAGKVYKKFVCVTFDDGYKDNYEIAYPLLKSRGIPFCIYVTSEFAEQKAILWWYLFDELFMKNERISIKLHGQSLSYDCSTAASQDQTELSLRQIIKKCPPESLGQTLTQIFSQHDVDMHKKTRALTLNWDEIAALSRDPLVTIGAHSFHHQALNTLSDSDLTKELILSRETIQRQINKPVQHFAYPYGSRFEAGPREFLFVAQNGYRTGVTSRLANIFPAHKHHLNALPRLEMPSIKNQHTMDAVVNGLVQAARYHLKRVVWDN